MKNKSLIAILLAFSMCIASVSPALAAENEAAMEEVPAEADEDAESAESDEETAPEEESALEGQDTDSVSARSYEEAAPEGEPAPEEPEFTGEIVVDGGEQSVIPGDSGKGDPNELFAEYVNEAFSTAGASKRKKARRNTGSRLT